MQPLRFAMAATAESYRFGWLAFILACCCALIATTEPDPFTFALVVTFLVGLVFAAAGASDRPGFALAFAAVLFVPVYVISIFKFHTTAMNLHVYDGVFYLFSAAQFAFFAQTFPVTFCLFWGSIALALALLFVGWRYERPMQLGRPRLLLAALGLAMLAGASTSLSARKPTFFDEGRYIFSAFIGSLLDMPALMQAKGFFEIGAHAGLPPVATSIVCKPGANAPDIVIFLNESAMPEGVYPQLAYPAELAPFFRSGDGLTHRLRVETFGGGTWLSDFSVLTGLPTNTFGNLRNFATQLMTGRLRHSLPQYLKACGYDTTMIYPSLAGFAGSGRFYQAIGFDRIIDRQVHRAADERQRDAFYLNEVTKVVEAAGSGPSRRPQFIVASSMASHSPWNFRFAPELVRPGETLRWTGDAEFDEYLWRMVLAKRDRDAFRADLAKRFPGRPFLFVGYGDHQPALTRLPLANATQIADKGTAWQLDPTSRAFETYYAIDGLNFAPKVALPADPVLEIPHLAALTVAAAGLPLDAVMQRRLWLIDRCRGLYGSCADRGAVAAFQHDLVEAGWIVSP